MSTSTTSMMIVIVLLIISFFLFKMIRIISANQSAQLMIHSFDSFDSSDLTLQQGYKIRRENRENCFEEM